jgi:hypothetical protein
MVWRQLSRLVVRLILFLIREWIDKRRAGPKLVLFTVRAYCGPAFWTGLEEK